MSSMPWRESEGLRYADSETDTDLAPLVLLHGLGNSSNFWHAVFEPVARSRRVLAIDIPGFGKSPEPSDGLTLETIRRDLLLLLESVQAKRSIVCGHSMGALVALSLATSDQQFLGLALIDGHLISATEAAKEPVVWTIRDPRLVFHVAAQFIGGALPLPFFVSRGVAASRAVRNLVFHPFVAKPGELDSRLTAEALRFNGGKGTLRAAQLARKFDIEALMRDVVVPVALIWGADDQLLRPEDLEQTRELMDVRSEIELPGVGHWPMIEDPERLIELLSSLDEHLRRPSDHSPT